jgi:SEC-C motif-containing protein
MANKCYCDSGLFFDQCCEPYLNYSQQPPSPVALMRSRYSAFATGNAEYLISTWDEAFRPKTLSLEPEQKWIGLKVLSHGEDINGTSGWVHFIARYKIAGKAQRLEERSLFSVHNKRWYYQQPDTHQDI